MNGAESKDPLPPGFRRYLQRQEASGWEQLEGTRFRGTIPITESWLSSLLEERAKSSSGLLRLHSVSILDGNVLRLHGTVGRSFLSKTVLPELQIEPLSGFPDPTLTLLLPPQYVLLLKGWLFAQEEARSAFLTVDDRALRVGLRDLIEYAFGPEGAIVIRFLKSATVRSEQGRLLIDFVVEVP